MADFRRLFLLPATLLVSLVAGSANAATTVTVATVNNADMIIMQRLADTFTEANPDIDLNWVVLEENVLRQRVTTDIATGGGQFDVMTIGSYEVPLWAKQGWLHPMSDLPESYDLDDVLQPIREDLTYDGTLYALPFYGESTITYYRKDLFEQAGITMPEQPTWDQIKEWAAQLHDPANTVYGICLRGKPGWGENVALISQMVHTFGGQWFDETWQPMLTSPEWKETVGFYVDLLNQYGPPGASSNGFNENLALFSTGKCALWVDATVAAGMLSDTERSMVADTVGFAPAPIQTTPKGSHWLWVWSLAIPASSDAVDAATTFVTWATSKDYVQLVADEVGKQSVPPGTRVSTYESAEYREAAPFADVVLNAIQTSDPKDNTMTPSPYNGIQYVQIPEFQAIGAQVGQMIAAALTNQMSVDQALQAAQRSTERTMRQAGYGR